MTQGEVPAAPLLLNGEGLTIAELRDVALRAVRVQIDPAATTRLRDGRAQLERAIAAAQSGASDDIYGVTTGYGNFKNRRIEAVDISRHQLNLIRSHCTGAGLDHRRDESSNSFPAPVVRAVLALRANTLLRGHSGPRVELVERLLALLEADILPEIPLRGSVGASGDLCPLSHLALGLIGEGRSRRGATGALRPTSELLAESGLSLTFSLAAKEGLALVNGTTVTTALTALAVHRAGILADTADAAAALSHEAMCGRLRAYDARVHAARAHPGQVLSAARLRQALAGSRLASLSSDRQDPYSLRCAPQVHGASRDAIAYCRRVVEIELNSTSDNPLLFFDEAVPADAGDPHPESGPAYSAGNFHAQPIALAADFLGIAVAELASISERRTQLLLDAAHNRGLPANLAVNAGLNSGLLLVQYLAAALVSENKVLAHPASVDSIPTASNAEDHVSMGTHAARKAGSICDNVEAVLAVELLVAAQATDWRLAAHQQDPTGRPPSCTSSSSAPPRVDASSLLGAGTQASYHSVRSLVDFVAEDRALDADIATVRQAVDSGAFAAHELHG